MEVYALFFAIGTILVTSLVACSSSSLSCKLFDKGAHKAT